MDTSKPARSIHKKGRRRVIGTFISAKMQLSVEWESQNERDFLYYLEFDDDVRGYKEQPIRYRYTLNDKYHYHYPDFEIFRHSSERRKFVEIKPLKVTMQDEFKEKTLAIKAKMLSDGFDYIVVTDSQIYDEPLLSNLKLLYRYINHEYDPESVKKMVYELVAMDRSSLKLKELKVFASKFSMELIDCYSCIAHKIFIFDVRKILSPDTELTLNRKTLP